MSPADESSRLDKWLFHARFCRSRTGAQDITVAGKVRLNGAKVRKPGHVIRPGDVLTLALGGAVRVVKVVALAERRGGAPQARNLYEIMD
jgi:ribosome-associated heat shock protein Hsp15